MLAIESTAGFSTGESATDFTAASIAVFARRACQSRAAACHMWIMQSIGSSLLAAWPTRSCGVCQAGKVVAKVAAYEVQRVHAASGHAARTDNPKEKRRNREVAPL
ncbi:hypothetical protein [Imbroritus primus]|uniref:hypothetical protein n=1 Tax=Imbroritus primus TaxID=3058603 RepID=UPI003D161ECA